MPHNQIDEKVRPACRPAHPGLMLKTVLALLLVAGTTICCAPKNIEIRVGRRPDIPAIEERLYVGQSTADDVLAVLGPPRGKGLAMLPIDPTQRTMWSYMYLESSIQTEGEAPGDLRSLILFVFFEQDRYAGYMWFSSVPQ